MHGPLNVTFGCMLQQGFLIVVDLKDKSDSSRYEESKSYLWFNRQCNRVARGTKASVGISGGKVCWKKKKMYQVVTQGLLTL